MRWHEAAEAGETNVRVVIGGMALPSTLPPPPPLHEAEILQAYTILQNGYTAARDVANLGRLDVHRVHYHQERVRSELIPLLDAIATSTSNSAMISWCYAATASFADLHNHLTQCETPTEWVKS
jgi:hypothetical protein